MIEPLPPETGDIDEKSLRTAIGHLVRWHWIGSALSLLITAVPAFIIVHFIAQIGWIQRPVLSFIDAMPFVTTPGRLEVVLFVIGALVLLFLTNIGTAIASDIVRTQIIGRINNQSQPVVLAEAMKTRLSARSGRLEQQYRFFPKHAENGLLASNGLYVGIGSMAPFWLLMVGFFFYFRW